MAGQRIDTPTTTAASGQDALLHDLVKNYFERTSPQEFKNEYQRISSLPEGEERRAAEAKFWDKWSTLLGQRETVSCGTQQTDQVNCLGSINLSSLENSNFTVALMRDFLARRGVSQAEALSTFQKRLAAVDSPEEHRLVVQDYLQLIKAITAAETGASPTIGRGLDRTTLAALVKEGVPIRSTASTTPVAMAAQTELTSLIHNQFFVTSRIQKDLEYQRDLLNLIATPAARQQAEKINDVLEKSNAVLASYGELVSELERQTPSVKSVSDLTTKFLNEQKGFLETLGGNLDFVGIFKENYSSMDLEQLQARTSGVRQMLTKAATDIGAVESSLPHSKKITGDKLSRAIAAATKSESEALEALGKEILTQRSITGSSGSPAKVTSVNRFIFINQYAASLRRIGDTFASYVPKLAKSDEPALDAKLLALLQEEVKTEEVAPQPGAPRPPATSAQSTRSTVQPTGPAAAQRPKPARTTEDAHMADYEKRVDAVLARLPGEQRKPTYDAATQLLALTPDDRGIMNQALSSLATVLENAQKKANAIDGPAVGREIRAQLALAASIPDMVAALRKPDEQLAIRFAKLAIPVVKDLNDSQLERTVVLLQEMLSNL